jgi:hypothetical protein
MRDKLQLTLESGEQVRDFLQKMAPEKLAGFNELVRKSPALAAAYAMQAADEIESRLDLRVQPYPWSGLKPVQLQQLAQGSVEAAVASVESQQDWARGRSDEERAVGRRTLWAIACWLRGERRVIRVSYEAQKALARMAVKRFDEGYSPARWFELPPPGSELYAEPIFFLWEVPGFALAKRPFTTFVRARGIAFEERMEYVHWQLIAAKNMAQPEWNVCWGTAPNIPTEITRPWFEEQWRVELELRAEDENYELPGTLSLMIMGINVMAALNQVNELRILRIPGGSSRKGRKRLSDGLRVKSVDLDEDALGTWVKTYVDPTKERRSGPSESGERKPAQGGTHAPPRMHMRDDHTVRVWVREERPGEEVLAVNEKGLKQVLRPRQGGVVGRESSEIATYEARVRLGPTDIDVKGD